MTISSPAVVNSTLIIDNTTGAITAANVRTMNDSLAGIASSIQTATYTAVLGDRGTVVEMNVAGAVTFFFPTNASVAFDVGTVIEIYQMGVGQVSLTAVTPATTTIRSSTGTSTTRAQYSTVSARKRATDEWVLSGDLS